MKIRPITIVIIIGSVLMVAFSVTIIKNKSIKTPVAKAIILNDAKPVVCNLGR